MPSAVNFRFAFFDLLLARLFLKLRKWRGQNHLRMASGEPGTSDIKETLSQSREWIQLPKYQPWQPLIAVLIWADAETSKSGFCSFSYADLFESDNEILLQFNNYSVCMCWKESSSQSMLIGGIVNAMHQKRNKLSFSFHLIWLLRRMSVTIRIRPEFFPVFHTDSKWVCI